MVTVGANNTNNFIKATRGLSTLIIFCLKSVTFLSTMIAPALLFLAASKCGSTAKVIAVASASLRLVTTEIIRFSSPINSPLITCEISFNVISI